MGERTAIAWTEKTWNPWQGCTRVSPGCAHCYMYTAKERYGQDPAAVVRSQPPTFNAPLRWREPARVFTCSWSDWFHEAADVWRDEAWDIIRRTPHLTYQILTKRPERIADHLPDDWGTGWPNVWLGVSVENQRFVDRVKPLADVYATVRFISAEPLLGPVTFLDTAVEEAFGLFIDWVIVGGESGPDHRPMDMRWARNLREECAFYEIPFFFKQRSGPRPGLTDGVPEDLLMQAFPAPRGRAAHA